MAQAIYDEHPLEEYLKESGDVPQSWPGDFDGHGTSGFYVNTRQLVSCLREVGDVLRIRLKIFKNAFPNHHQEFTERFKYDVITSKLLSTSLESTPLHTPRRSRSPDRPFPGNLNDPSGSRNTQQLEDENAWSKSVPYTLAAVVAAIVWQMSAALAVMIMITSIYFIRAHKIVKKREYIAETLSSLDALKSAVDVWSSIVNESFAILESQEQGSLLGPSTTSPISSSLSVTLRTSLLTTHTQCDNVRQLLTAITCPSELPQLSEMYAPPSPINTVFPSSVRHRSPSPRDKHLSLPDQRRASLALPRDNRSTWNGSYTSLAGLDVHSRHKSLGRIRRRPSLLSSFSALDENLASSSSSPLSLRPEDEILEEASPSSERDEFGDTFGAAALSLRKVRRTSGMESIGLTHRRSTPSMKFGSSSYLSSPPSSSARFTTFQAVRHPLSLPAIHQALQGALAAKRYACAHLLALRFEEDEDDAYWENVRSVIALLTTTFEDASSRLEDALADVERQKSFDQLPETPPESPVEANDSDKLPASPTPLSSVLKRLSIYPTNSYAPVPNHIARFAAHVDAISSALSDAQEHLKNCVASLREEDGGVGSSRFADTPVEQSPALSSYEQLRREIGLALRECERGRGVLLDICSKPRDILQETEEEDYDSLPHLAHDTGSSGESDGKQEITPSTPDNFLSSLPQSTPYTLETRDGTQGIDETTQHLLITSTVEHLPPPGDEQVFESETGAGTPFTRERSRLTREERIKLVKSRRESAGKGLALNLGSLPESDAQDENQTSRGGLGPGSEVVQELKDVIWKVGERRRSLQSRNMSISKIPVRVDTPEGNKSTNEFEPRPPST